MLFLQGGASTQFSAIPLNLCKQGDTVDYVVTGEQRGRRGCGKWDSKDWTRYGLSQCAREVGEGKEW